MAREEPPVDAGGSGAAGVESVRQPGLGLAGQNGFHQSACAASQPSGCLLQAITPRVLRK